MRPGDAVHIEPVLPLVAAQRALRGRVEVAVDRDERAVAGEEELEHRDIPAEHPQAQRPPAEERLAERAEGLARAQAGKAVDRQAGTPLEGLRRAGRLRPGDRVDRAPVEPVRAQGDLEPGDLRVRGARGRRQQKRCQRRRGESDDPAVTSGPGSPPRADSSNVEP